jgi:acyl-CoA hydrolase/RimJ/RimL family protein N-acetyltransferase
MSSMALLEQRAMSAEQAVANIQAGERVFVGTGCATPRALVAALEARAATASDVQLVHFLTTGAVARVQGKPVTAFKHKVFFVGSDTRELVRDGRAEYVPISLSHVPGLIANGRVDVDVALVQVSLPDEHGYVSLGVSVDITRAAVEKAKVVIAEVNPQMPFTFGESFVPISRLDRVVLVDHPVTEYQHPPTTGVADQIARYVARIIDDGATLQVGLGRIPNDMLRYLTHRKDLGIHSDVITDPLVDLIEQGVVTGNKKTLHKGRVVTSFCLGSARLYKLVHRNPAFSFQPIEYVCNPAVIAANRAFVSVTQAFAIDLTGQVCADQFEGEFYGGLATQADFMRGAANSPGGKPILCLPSTTDDGSQSRIRPLLHEGEGVTIPRSDVHYVVTEWGSVYLFGKSIRERALSIIEIAHPKFREWLLDEARRLGYVRPEQQLKSKVAYPEEEEREVTLKGGKTFLLRPARASDVGNLHDIFYNLTAEDRYTRFFTRLKALSVDAAEHLCNVDYDHEMAFVAVYGDREGDRIVGSCCYYVNPTTNLAEVAYMILPEWQGVGLGGALQQRMIEYAKKRGLRGFTADILAQNAKMKKLFQSGSPNVSVERDGDTYEVTMLF